MKKKNAILRTLLALSLLTLISCGENSSTLSNYDFEGSKVSPDAKKVDFNENGEAVIELDPVAPEKWTDPAFQKLEEEIRRSRAARVKAKLAKIKDERIDFSHPTLTLKNNGQKQVDIDVKFKNEKSTITFLSPEKHEQDFFFEYTSGFDQRKVSLQGMCLDENEETCEVLAVQVAYIVDKTKYTEQFVLDIGQINLDEDDFTDKTEDKKDIIKQPKEDEDLKKISEPISAKERETYIPSSLPDLDQDQKDKVKKEDTDSNKGVSAKERETYIPNSLPDLPKEEPKPISAKERETYIPNSLPDLPKEEEKKEVEKVEEEEEEELKNIPIPTPNPRKQDIHEDAPALSVGSGQIQFRDLKEDEAKKVEEVFNVTTGETTKIVKKPESPTNPEKALLHQIRYKVFNQSFGFYAGGKNNAGKLKRDKDGKPYRIGRMKNASHLSRRIKGAVANSGRTERQYGSGILTSTLKYSAEKFNLKYPNSPICINDLSLKKGGRLSDHISSHGSHRNGLDADISIPSTANRCRQGGNFFPTWTSLKSKDSNFLKKNWELIKILLSTDRVHGIFIDENFIARMCKFVKKNTKTSKEDRRKIFKKLHHIKGHKDHYHVRMKCNQQNPGCQTQDILKGSTCK